MTEAARAAEVGGRIADDPHLPAPVALPDPFGNHVARALQIPHTFDAGEHLDERPGKDRCTAVSNNGWAVRLVSGDPTYHGQSRFPYLSPVGLVTGRFPPDSASLVTRDDTLRHKRRSGARRICRQKPV